MNTPAKIRALYGKYYGTLIDYDLGQAVKIWYMGNWKPSERQLADWEMTLEEAKDDMMLSDSHFESEQGYLLAEAVCKAINETMQQWETD